MIKVLFIINSLESGGAERVMSILANELANLDYDISIISKVNRKPFYELGKNVKVIFPLKSINYKNKIKTLLDRISVYLEIYEILKREKPDIVIPFSTTTNGTIIPISKILGLKVIACEHNNYKLNLHSFPIWFIKRIIYPRANWLTVLTNRDKELFYSRFMENVTVMPNPLPLLPLASYDRYRRDKTMLAIGNLNRWRHKGFDNLIKIFSSIVQAFPDWKLQIAGAGNSTYLKSLAEELGVSKNVEFMGEVKNIADLMKQSSIFVLSSRYEGLPMVLIEAMSQGMACIAFDCFTGPSDIIDDRKNGVLVRDQNNSDFIELLSWLIENPEKRKEMGIFAIDKSKDYLPEKIVAKWQTIITQTLNKQ